MRIALALYRYFPHGGLQRDFLATARRCAERGHSVTVLAAEWQGPPPEGITLQLLPVRGLTNHARMARFGQRLRHWRRQHPEEVLLGFNRLPSLDLYFAADNCFAESLQNRSRWARLLPRYRTYLALERWVAGSEGAARLLFLNPNQADSYLRHYHLREHRYRILPPGVRRDRRPGDDADEQRRRVRSELGVEDGTRLLLFLGSDFARKGLDRVLFALTHMNEHPDTRTVLLVVGDDDPAPYRATLSRMGLSDQVCFTGGRDDVPALLQAADLLVHPAYHEPAGMALLEATVSGLPVLTTGACGYAPLIEEAGSGRVVPEPFSSETFQRELTFMLEQGPEPWRQAGLRYGTRGSLYCFHDRIVDEIEALEGHEASSA